MADGILGRWSQRKQAAREGKPLEDPLRVPTPAVAPATTASVTGAVANDAAATPIAPEPEQQQTPPPPTLQDVQALTPESDFSAFTGANVSPEVSNAAMKKLFADPHYNVMDGLDIYIDDYGKPDPMPLSMIRKLAGAQFLNLFDDEKEGNPATLVTDNAPASAVNEEKSEEKSEEEVTLTQMKTQDHAHPDLRLQPNHAAGSPEPGRSAE